MAPELTVALCAQVALTSLWLGYALGRAESGRRTPGPAGPGRVGVCVEKVRRVDDRGR
jgi:hypothetical protein